VGPVGTHGEYERGEEIDEDVVAGGHGLGKDRPVREERVGQRDGGSRPADRQVHTEREHERAYRHGDGEADDRLAPQFDGDECQGDQEEDPRAPPFS